MEKEEILQFARQMKPREHVIMFHSSSEDKHRVLFTYLKAGLDQGEAAVYVASEETVDEIRQAMRRFGMDVDELERHGALRVIDWRDWYIIGGKFSIAETLERWKRMYDEAVAKGFKGLRITGETACFFRERMVKELVEYEQALHRVLELPMSAICAYDSRVVANEREGIDSIAPEQVERNFISIVPPIIVDAVRKLEPYCGTTRTVSIRYSKLLLILYQTEKYVIVLSFDPEAKTPFADKLASDLGKIVRATEDQP